MDRKIAPRFIEIWPKQFAYSYPREFLFGSFMNKNYWAFKNMPMKLIKTFERFYIGWSPKPNKYFDGWAHEPKRDITDKLISVKYMFNTSALIGLFHKQSLEESSNLSTKSKETPVEAFLACIYKKHMKRTWKPQIKTKKTGKKTKP